jgi:isoamyl acetate esterase
MKKTILIGDSIRLHYQETVKYLLKEEAEVWGPESNAYTSTNVLKHLEEWAVSKNADVIHINCGLHDIKRFNQEEPVTPLETYKTNIEKIFNLLLYKTNAQIIWATITPVNFERHHQKKDFDRFESDVNKYNQAALTVAEKLNIPVNDLFKAIEQQNKNRLLKDDGVHFNLEGNELLGKKVAECIKTFISGGRKNKQMRDQVFK